MRSRVNKDQEGGVMTWEGVKQAILNAHPKARDAGDEVLLILAFGVEDETQRVGVRVSNGTTAEGPGILVLSKVCSRTQLDPSMALRHGMTLGVGAFALADETYVLRHVMQLADASPERIERVLQLLAHEAARLKTSLSRRVDEGQVFIPYAE